MNEEIIVNKKFCEFQVLTIKGERIEQSEKPITLAQALEKFEADAVIGVR